MTNITSCTLCPRECHSDRTKKSGLCGAPNGIRAARAALHMWEEPCISGTRGSGTVFFSGCPLSCVYCQNKKISLGGYGAEISVDRLSEIFLELEALGAHNINLVSPTPYVPFIIDAIDKVRGRINIPFVYNTGGYESIKTLKMLRGYIDIYLTDIKYFSPMLSEKYSRAADYFDIASSAAAEMIYQTGVPSLTNDGIMRRGTIIRHLVLPSHRTDSIEIIREISKRFERGSFILSLMSQYTPYELLPNLPELNRRITSFEYQSVVDEAIRLGLTDGYMQERTSAKKEYTPEFNLIGL